MSHPNTAIATCGAFTLYWGALDRKGFRDFYGTGPTPSGIVRIALFWTEADGHRWLQKTRCKLAEVTE